MKNQFLARLAILTLALAGVFSIPAMAQTTDEGTNGCLHLGTNRRIRPTFHRAKA